MVMRRLQTVLAALGTAVLLLAFTGCTGEPGSFSVQATMVPSVTPVTTVPKAEPVECDEGPCAMKTRGALRDSIERIPKEAPGLPPDKVYDEEYAFAVRLVLSYDPTAGLFKGAVVNIAGDTLARIRVEVRLDGSSDRVANAPSDDLVPGQVMEVSIPAGSDPFAYWEVDTELERTHRLD